MPFFDGLLPDDDVREAVESSVPCCRRCGPGARSRACKTASLRRRAGMRTMAAILPRSGFVPPKTMFARRSAASLRCHVSASCDLSNSFACSAGEIALVHDDRRLLAEGWYAAICQGSRRAYVPLPNTLERNPFAARTAFMRPEASRWSIAVSRAGGPREASRFFLTDRAPLDKGVVCASVGGSTVGLCHSIGRLRESSTRYEKFITLRIWPPS